MRWALFSAVLLIAATPAALSGQGQSPLPFDFTHNEASELGLKAPNAVPKRIRYGDKGWQEIYFYPVKGAKAAPVVIGLGPLDDHGWPRYQFNRAGIAFAFIPNEEREPNFARESLANYRAAIGTLYNQADKLGIDRTRIILAGAYFGADMATLFGTDPNLLDKVAVPFESLRGVISVDGEGFDLTRRSAESKVMRQKYKRAYSGDAAELAAFSPLTHVAPPNAPAFLLLASPDHADGIRESSMMAQSLLRAGTVARFATLPDKRKGSLRTVFLAEQGGSGWEIMDFLSRHLR